MPERTYDLVLGGKEVVSGTQNFGLKDGKVLNLYSWVSEKNLISIFGRKTR